MARKPSAHDIRKRYADAHQKLADHAYGPAAKVFEDLSTALGAMGDFLGQARVLLSLAQTRELLGQLADAETGYRNALRLGEGLGDGQIEATAANRLALLLRRERPEEASALWERSAVVCQSLGDRVGGALAIAMAGQCDCERGELRQGIRRLLAALEEMPPNADERASVERMIEEWRVDAPAHANGKGKP